MISTNDRQPDAPLVDSADRAGETAVCTRRPRGPARWPVYLLLAAMILVPAIFWRQVWWGSPLSDDEIRERLSHADNVRHVQHALEQISRRMQQDPVSARPFYPQVMGLADHREPMVRAAAAWLMGEDNSHEPFREQLRRLLGDAEPVVRYNAATSLTRFGDASSRPVLREMLDAHVVKADWRGTATDGTVVDTLREGDFARPLTQLALVDLGDGEQQTILAPLEGRLARVKVDKGRRVHEGEEIAEIAPNPAQVEAALRGLYLVGRAEDLEAIEPYLDTPAGFPDRIGQQARATAAAVRERRGSG